MSGWRKRRTAALRLTSSNTVAVTANGPWILTRPKEMSGAVV